ncbi:YibE/F family protein [Clostridium hydrogenum]|uniref:YibE/F family protein n=1 Tax=Clostridium hydrogenum TaxID=2855764 RepID=UPI001F1983F7|nr:YibE/F family protein [Clostridium hydrogenum]
MKKYKSLFLCMNKPLLMTIMSSIIIVCILMIGLNGINKKTLASIMGTVLGVT